MVRLKEDAKLEVLTNINKFQFLMVRLKEI
jgi:hypothetical protein